MGNQIQSVVEGPLLLGHREFGKFVEDLSVSNLPGDAGRVGTVRPPAFLVLEVFIQRLEEGADDLIVGDILVLIN